jgi:phosphatidylinositol alpha-1,6-mannosyltransferase
LLKKLVAHSVTVSTVSNGIKDIIVKKQIVAEDKIVLAPGALPQKFYYKNNVSRPDSRQNNCQLKILTVARIHPRKGQDIIIKALQRLPAEIRKKIEYTMVGPEAFCTKYEQYLPNLKLLAENADFKVSFRGRLSDEELAAEYGCADIFALTSVRWANSVEGFGIVYLEAGSFKLPVIAHDVGGVKDAVINNETGILVAHNELQELTQAFAKLIANPGLRRQMGDAGYERALQSSWISNVRVLFNHLPTTNS